MMTVARQKIARIETASIHAQMEIHVIKRPNVVLKIIAQFVRVQQAILVIHLWIVSSNEMNQGRNVQLTVIVQTRKLVLIKLAEIHVLNATHAV